MGLQFSTKSLTSPEFSCTINLTLVKKLIFAVNYCNTSQWELTLGLPDSHMPNLIASSKKTIIYDSKENMMYMCETGNHIRFYIGLILTDSGYRFSNTIGFEKDQNIPAIDIDLSSIIEASIKRDKFNFSSEGDILISEGVHEQNNIISMTKVWLNKKTNLPVKIELAQRLSSSGPDWRQLALFEKISTRCNIKGDSVKFYKDYAKKNKIKIVTIDEIEIAKIFPKMMKELGLTN